MRMCHQSEELYVLTEDERHKLQAHLRKMYKEVERVCDRHGLTIMLADGSLLGAVRHSGFIPWDDDIDLNMPRKDYEEFINNYASELPSNYVVYAPNSIAITIKNFFLFFIRISASIVAVKGSTRHVQKSWMFS